MAWTCPKEGQWIYQQKDADCSLGSFTNLMWICTSSLQVVSNKSDSIKNVHRVWAWRGVKFLFSERSLLNSYSGTKAWKKMKPLSNQQLQRCHLHAPCRLFDLFKLPFGKQGTGSVWVAVCRAICTSICTWSCRSEVDKLIQSFHLITSSLCAGGGWVREGG